MLTSPTTMSTSSSSFTSSSTLTFLSTLLMLTPLIESYFYPYELRILLSINKRISMLAQQQMKRVRVQWKKNDDERRKEIREELDRIEAIRTSPTRSPTSEQSSLDSELRSYFLNSFTCTNTLFIHDIDTMTTSQYFDALQVQMEKDCVIENISSSHLQHLRSLVMRDGAMLELPMNYETHAATGGIVLRRKVEQAEEEEKKKKKKEVEDHYKKESGDDAASTKPQPQQQQQKSYTATTSSSSSSSSSTSTSTTDDPVYTQNLADFTRQIIRLLLVTHSEHLAMKTTNLMLYHERKEKLNLLLDITKMCLLSNPRLRANVTSVSYLPIPGEEELRSGYPSRVHLNMSSCLYDVVLKGEVHSESRTEVEKMKGLQAGSRWHFRRDHFILTDLLTDVNEFLLWMTCLIRVDEERRDERMVKKRKEKEDAIQNGVQNLEQITFLAPNDSAEQPEADIDLEPEDNPRHPLHHLLPDSLNLLRSTILQALRTIPGSKYQPDGILEKVRCVSLCDDVSEESKKYILSLSHPDTHPSPPPFYTIGASSSSVQVIKYLHCSLLSTATYAIRLSIDPLKNKRNLGYSYGYLNQLTSDLPYTRYDLLELLFSTSEFRVCFYSIMRKWEKSYTTRTERAREEQVLIEKSKEWEEVLRKISDKQTAKEEEEEEQAKQASDIVPSPSAAEDATTSASSPPPPQQHLVLPFLPTLDPDPTYDRSYRGLWRMFFCSKRERQSLVRLIVSGAIKSAMEEKGRKEQRFDVLSKCVQASLKKTRELLQQIAKKHETSSSSSTSASSSSSSSSSSSFYSSSPLYHRFLHFLYFDCIRRKDVFLLRTLTQLMLREDNFHAAALFDVETNESPLHYMERHAFGKSRWRIFDILFIDAVALHSGKIDAVLDHTTTNVSGEVTFRELVKKNWNRDMKERLEELYYPQIVII